MKMNRLLWLCVALISLLSFNSIMAQNDEITQQQADKLNSLTFKLAKQGRYEDAIKSYMARGTDRISRKWATMQSYTIETASQLKPRTRWCKCLSYTQKASAAEIHYTPPTWTISHSIRLHKTNMMTLLPIARGHWRFMTV